MRKQINELTFYDGKNILISNVTADEILEKII